MISSGIRKILNHARTNALSLPLLCFLLILCSTITSVHLGAYTNLQQILYLLIKLPCLYFFSLIISFTSIYVITKIIGVNASLRELFFQSLISIVLWSVVMASMFPIILFHIFKHSTHDEMLMIALFLFALSAIGPVYFLSCWISEKKSPKKIIILIAWIALYGVIILQLGWMMRPWIGEKDPVYGTLPFSRWYSGNVFIEIQNTIQRTINN